MEGVFYVLAMVLVVTLACYGLLMFQSYRYEQAITVLQQKLQSSGTEQQRQDEKTVLGYKRKIDDVMDLLRNRTVAMPVLAFVESSTVKDVTFATFHLDSTLKEIRLTGVAQTVQALALQMQALEKRTDLIKSISVLDSEVGTDGNVSFTVNMTLEPTIFNDTALSLIHANQ